MALIPSLCSRATPASIAAGDGAVGVLPGQLVASTASTRDFNTFLDLFKDTEDVCIRAVDSRRPLTYKRLLEFSNTLDLSHFGIGIDREAKELDRLCVMIPNGPELAVCFLSMSQYCTYAPLDINLTQTELEFELADMPAKALVVLNSPGDKMLRAATKLCVPIIELVSSADEVGTFSLRWSSSSPRQLPKLSQRVRAQRKDIALVLHTSGTTKKPKLVPLTHENICVGASCIASTIRIEPGDVNMNMMPLHHIHGISINVLASLLAGASLLATPGFDNNEVLGWLAKGDAQPNWYSAVPTMHQLVCERGEEAKSSGTLVHNLKLIRNCSAALMVHLSTRMETAFDLNVMPTYAMTESMPICSNPRVDRGDGAQVCKLASVGLAGGPSVRILDDAGQPANVGDEGEVCVQGECVTGGYEYRAHMGEGNDPNIEAFHRLDTRWLRTGDKGFIDKDRYLTLVGRFKEIINRAGEKISPLQIEEVLQQHPACKRLLCFAMPHDTYGEVTGAAVVLDVGAKLEISDLKSFGMDRGLPARFLPELIIFMSKIPVGTTGKPARIDLAGPGPKCRYKMQPMGMETCGLWSADADGRVAPYDALSNDSNRSAGGLQEAVLDAIAVHMNAKRSSIGLDMEVEMIGIDSVRVLGFARTLREKLGCAVTIRDIAGKTVSQIVQALEAKGHKNLQASVAAVPALAPAPAAAPAAAAPATPPAAAAALAVIPRPLDTKVIHPSAQIAEDVSIGYFSMVEEGACIGRGAVIESHCVIEAGATIGAGCRIGRFTVIGSRVVLGQDTTVDTHCSFQGDGSIRIGSQNKIGSHCRITAYKLKDTVIGDRNEFHSQVVLGFPPQDYAKRPPPAGGILIGNDNVFREGVSIDAACGSSAGSGSRLPPLTQICNNCYIMRNAHIAHDGLLEDNVVLTMNVQLAGYARIMHHANLGVGVVVHQFTTIGPYCMVGMGTVVTRDPLPFTTYVSREGSNGSIAVNRVGLERAAKKTVAEVEELECFYQDDFNPIGGGLALQARSDKWFHLDLHNFDRHRAEQEKRRPLGDWLR